MNPNEATNPNETTNQNETMTLENQNETPECRICQGETVYRGTLCSSLIYRCRHCGIETFKRLEMPNEEPECPQCDGADNQPDPEGNYELECGACGWKFNNPNETMTQENETQNPTRMAIVTIDGLTLKEVQQYLPSNYGAFRRPDGRIQITGRDDKGWTMDGYVIPRLSSGLIPAREFTSMEDEANNQEAEQERIGNLFTECVDDLYKCKEALDDLEERIKQSTSTPEKN
jgi:ribosomal protein L37AE/L43A